MEYLNFNETLYSAPGINSHTTDILSIELRNFEDDGFNSANSTVVPPNATGDTGDEITNLLGLDHQNNQRLVGIFFLIVCTITGNITLIAALTYKRSRRIKRVNIFLVNLAISDLAVAFITMTTEILFIAFGEWVLGPVLCKLSVYLEVVTLDAATFLLTAMSIDRYQVIVKPLESLTNRPKIWKKVTVAWCLAFIFAVPQLFIFKQVTKIDKKDGRYKHMCQSKGYHAEWQRKLYFTFFACYVLIIPAIIMTFCYLKIMKVIWKRSENGEQGSKAQCNGKVAVSPRMSVNRNLVSSSRRKVVILTLTVIIGFLVCLTPYFVVSLIRIYSTYRIKLTEYLHATEMIFMLHSTLNPILFGIFSFRLQHISCLVPKVCKGCFFGGFKDSAQYSPSKRDDRYNVKLRLMASSQKPQYHVTHTPVERRGFNCGRNVKQTDHNFKPVTSKPLLSNPTTRTTDSWPNGNIIPELKAHLRKCSEDESETAHLCSEDNACKIADNNHLCREQYSNGDSDRSTSMGQSTSVNRELTEYVSCV